MLVVRLLLRVLGGNGKLTSVRQYGFSVAIACTTYMSLRYPMSRVKAFAESWWGDILGLVFLSGVIQAIVWWFAHGVSGRSIYPLAQADIRAVCRMEVRR